MSPSHFRELEVWRLGMQLAKSTYMLTSGFPKEERYGLPSQMHRAAVSIPSNIAEGNARNSTKDYARFVSMACGSAAELQTQLMLAASLQIGDAALLADATDTIERVSKMLHGLRLSLHARIEAASPVPGPRSRT